MGKYKVILPDGVREEDGKYIIDIVKEDHRGKDGHTVLYSVELLEDTKQEHLYREILTVLKSFEAKDVS